MHHWKIERDPYYRPLFEKHGLEYIKEAGFMFDTSTEDYDIMSSLDIMCTPLNFMQGLSLPKSCILVTTGSFSPIHSGHIEMMTKTKETLEKDGWHVAGGYFAPDHDEYIKWKLKEEAIPIHYRIKQITKAVEDIDWLTVDPWAGVFQKVAVNFTDIVRRLEAYVERHTGLKIPVFFVCGADNARFAKTFGHHGYCAVVDRAEIKKESDELLARSRENYLWHLRIFKKVNDRLYFVENNNSMSSTDVRKMLKWKKEKKNVVIRVTDENDPRNRALIELVAKRFENVDVKYSSQQLDVFKSTMGGNVISLDPFTEAGYNIEISRKYDYFGIKKLGYTQRPGSAPLSQQIDLIPDDEHFFLHDDDIHTGETIAFVERMLTEHGKNIAGSMSYTRSNKNQEIIDIRDFMYGKKDGGLVMDYRGMKIRVPYIYPFVCPFSRASINDPMEFSIEVWKINIAYFESVIKFPGSSKYKKYLEESQRYLDLLAS